MQQIIDKSGVEQPEPGDSGFEQIVAHARVARLLDEDPHLLVRLGNLAEREAIGSMRGLQELAGRVASSSGPEPMAA